MADKPKRTPRPVLGLEEKIQKTKTGFLVVRSDREPAYVRVMQLRKARKIVDKLKDVWGSRTWIVDCQTKKPVYEFRSLGAS